MKFKMNYNKIPPKLDNDYDKLSRVSNDEIFEELLNRGVLKRDDSGNIEIAEVIDKIDLKNEIKISIRNHITRLVDIYGPDMVFESLNELVDEYIDDDEDDDILSIEEQLNALHCRVAENYNDTMFSINMLEGDINDIMDKLNKLETRIQPSKTTAQ